MRINEAASTAVVHNHAHPSHDEQTAGDRVAADSGREKNRGTLKVRSCLTKGKRRRPVRLRKGRHSLQSAGPAESPNEMLFPAGCKQIEYSPVIPRSYDEDHRFSRAVESKIPETRISAVLHTRCHREVVMGDAGLSNGCRSDVQDVSGKLRSGC